MWGSIMTTEVQSISNLRTDNDLHVSQDETVESTPGTHMPEVAEIAFRNRYRSM